MTQFAFLSAEFPALHNSAKKAEAAALSDPRGACFYARLTLETALKWLFETDPALQTPYQDSLAALIHEPSLMQLAGQAIVTKARYVKDQGNRAAHDARPVSAQAASTTVRELFHICYWIARTYARTARPDPGLTFDLEKLEKTITISASTVEQIKALKGKHDAAETQLKAEREARTASDEGRAALEAELASLRAEVAAARKANDAIPDDHDYDEATTRDAFIDLLLAEAGWPLADARDREFPVKGVPNATG
jgi:type I restriction enzyme R subunit